MIFHYASNIPTTSRYISSDESLDNKLLLIGKCNRLCCQICPGIGCCAMLRIGGRLSRLLAALLGSCSRSNSGLLVSIFTRRFSAFIIGARCLALMKTNPSRYFRFAAPHLTLWILLSYI